MVARTLIQTGATTYAQQTSNFHSSLTKRLYLLPGVDIKSEFILSVTR